MYSRLDSITSGAFGRLMFDEPLDTVAITLRLLTLACAPFWWKLGRRVSWRWLQGGLPLCWSWRWTWGLSMYLGMGVLGCLHRLAVLLGLFWVLGNGSVRSATRASNQML